MGNPQTMERPLKPRSCERPIRDPIPAALPDLDGLFAGLERDGFSAPLEGTG